MIADALTQRQCQMLEQFQWHLEQSVLVPLPEDRGLWPAGNPL